MRSSRTLALAATTLAIAAMPTVRVLAEPAQNAPRLGVPVASSVAASWDTTIFPDGRGLPVGRGSAKEGAAIYDEKCSSCHGPEGRGETAEELAGGVEPLDSPDAAQTVAAYWPYATTLFDYVRRAMPMDKPGSLSPDEIYALCAYLLQLDGVIPAGSALDASTLPNVRMPNRDGFDRIDAK